MRAADAKRQLEGFPFASLDAIAPGTSLILAPHADDESLGCGGLIAAACAAARPPLIVCITDGTGSHPGSAAYPAPRLRMLREAELRSAASILGLAADRVHFLGLPDAAAPTSGPVFEAAVRSVAELALAHDVTTLLTTWPHDPHCDHEMAAQLGAEAAFAAGRRHALYPVWGWLLPEEAVLPEGRLSGARLDIEAFLPLKRRAIEAHASQYGGLVTDDPGGFRLPPELLAVFDRPYEVFIDP